MRWAQRLFSETRIIFFCGRGLEVFREFGGLHKFMNWHKPILTDSGGFQVFSLAKLRSITDAGVEFRSHLDGSKFFLGPKESMQIQHELGSDIIMAFDECPALAVRGRRRGGGCEEEPSPWAQASLEHHQHLTATHDFRPTREQALFGIVQGGGHPHLREECACALRLMGFDGFCDWGSKCRRT